MKLTNGWRRVAYLLPLVLILVPASACSGSTPEPTEAPLPTAYPGPYPGAALPLTQPVNPYPDGSKGTDSTVKPVLNSNDWSPAPGDENLSRGEVEIAESGILASQANPQIYALYFSGMLPTPCHKLRVQVSDPDDQGQIQVEAYTVSDPNEMCIQVLEPYSAEVPLEDYVQGTNIVILNGQPVQ